MKQKKFMRLTIFELETYGVTKVFSKYSLASDEEVEIPERATLLCSITHETDNKRQLWTMCRAKARARLTALGKPFPPDLGEQTPQPPLPTA